MQCVKKFVAEIQRIDPNATKFKYPVDKGNQPIERKSELASFKRSTYVDKFREKEDTGKISLKDLEDLEIALKHYLKVVELDPDFPYASNNAEIIKNIIKDYEK